MYVCNFESYVPIHAALSHGIDDSPNNLDVKTCPSFFTIRDVRKHGYLKRFTTVKKKPFMKKDDSLKNTNRPCVN
jgi:hypothetical protein